MSDLNPKGVQVIFDGIGTRHFLFTLNAIDALESEYEKPLFDIIGELYDDEVEDKKHQNETLKNIVYTLLEDEYNREKWKNPSSEIEKVDKQEIGWLINIQNMMPVKLAIMQACGISMPAVEETDPNERSSQSE